MQIGKLLGSGYSSEVFAYGKNYSIKLFKTEYPQLCEKEYNNYKIIENSDLLVPKCYDLIEVNGRKGLVLDYIEGCNFTTYIIKNPHKFIKMLNKFTDTFTQITSIFISEKIDKIDNNKEFYSRVKSITRIRSEVKDFIIETLNKDNFNRIFIHGDFNPHNVIVRNEEIFVVDWSYCTFSDIEKDIAAFQAHYQYMENNISLKGIDFYFSNFYHPFIFKAFYYNLKRKIQIDEKKFKFWRLVYNSYITDKLSRQDKINKNMQIIESDYKFIKSSF